MEKAKVTYICIGKIIFIILEVLFYDYQFTVFELFSSYNGCVTYLTLCIRVYIRIFVFKVLIFASFIHTYIYTYVYILGMISIFI